MGHTRGYEIIKSDTSRRQHNSGKPDPRGRKSLLSEKDVDRIDEILQTLGFDGRAITWTQLAATADAPSVSWRTIQCAPSNRGYTKCIACTKTYVSKPLMDKRKAWANQKRNGYSIDAWKKVCFLDEAYSDEDLNESYRLFASKVNVHVKTVFKNRMSQSRRIKNKYHHCWAAVGYNFKSELIFYEVPGNSNRKMNQRVYINSILEPIVKPWLKAGEDFVLEKNNDSGHGSDWKAEYLIIFTIVFFNLLILFQ